MATAQQPISCIIGAGSSGIAVAKALADRGLRFDCFEMSDEIGGNWTYKNRNGLSACYESLHINTTLALMEYRDFPMPRDLPAYPNHRQIKAYFDDYVDHFDLRRRITFNTAVAHARQLADGRWQVRLSNGEEREYDKLIVANGHHWKPHWPEPAIPGHFDGVEFHSHSYCNPTDPVDMHGKRVVVIGMGNSAMDIASEISRVGCADRVYLVARRGVWIMPKFIAGKAVAGELPSWLPWRLLSALFHPLLKLTVGWPKDYGLPQPKHPFLGAHPTISQDIYGRIGSGDIIVKPEMIERKGKSVRFADGSEVEADIVVYCTGYQVSFPFFDPEFLAAPNNTLSLWRRMIKPDIDNLYFVGLLQPLGAMMPIAEKQGKLIAAHIAGDVQFPDRLRMQKDIARDERALKKRYVASPRHTMQVDAPRYLKLLDNLIRRRRHA